MSDALELLLTVSRSLRVMKGELELEPMELTSEAGSESGSPGSQSDGGGEGEMEKVMARFIVMA